MACNTNVNTTSTNRGYIYETVVKIDQLQKEASIENVCEGCEGSLMARIYNTKPITFYLSNGTSFTVNIPGTDSSTNIFRIDDVRNDAVILRLIDSSTVPFTCTTYTVVLSINCVCGIQCYSPICCELCNRQCGQL